MPAAATLRGTGAKAALAAGQTSIESNVVFLPIERDETLAAPSPTSRIGFTCATRSGTPRCNADNHEYFAETR